MAIGDGWEWKSRVGGWWASRRMGARMAQGWRCGMEVSEDGYFFSFRAEMERA